jgi:AraC-like DNA-binding protein
MTAIKWASYEDRLNRVTAYLYEHLDETLDLEKLAEVAALSPYHWHRVAPVPEITPFWRVIGAKTPTARGLACGIDFIHRRRREEGLEP